MNIPLHHINLWMRFRTPNICCGTMLLLYSTQCVATADMSLVEESILMRFTNVTERALRRFWCRLQVANAFTTTWQFVVYNWRVLHWYNVMADVSLDTPSTSNTFIHSPALTLDRFPYRISFSGGAGVVYREYPTPSTICLWLTNVLCTH